MKPLKNPVVAGIGEILWDIFPLEKKAGGAPVNFVYHAMRLGAKGYAISAVGSDALGKQMLRELDKAGIGGQIDVLPYPTGSVKVTLKDGIPSYEFAQDTAFDHLQLSLNAINIIKKADAICFGTLAFRNAPSAETLFNLLNHANKNALKFFDVNLRKNYYSKPLLAALLKQAGALKMNEEELAVLGALFYPGIDLSLVCQKFLNDYKFKYVILTAGEKYSEVYSQKEFSRLITPRVTVADTVGAGDAFSGAFIYGVLTGMPLKTAHKEAVKTAAFAATKTGAWPSYKGIENFNV